MYEHVDLGKIALLVDILSYMPIGPSMSFYPDFIQILSRFYPDLSKSFKN